jgi:tetratricopeptide (TPR) repeat protein
MEVKAKTNVNSLIKSAIREASNNNWEKAKKLNLVILNISKNNIETLNRLGISYMKLSDKVNATKCFKNVLKISPNNVIAQKNLNKLQLNLPEITINLSKIDSSNLINETGKSIHLKCDIKNSKKILNQGIDTGSKLTIRNEKDSIGIYKGNSKIHIIDNSIAKRISNLINLGNEYICTVLGVSENSININIKETSKSKKTMQIISFPEYLNSDLHKTSINQNIKNLNLVNVDEFD